MPACAWPGTVHRYGYEPFLVNVTVSVALLPGWTSGLVLPSILKSCATAPTFFRWKVTVPSSARLVERRKANSFIPTSIVLFAAPALALLAAGALAGAAVAMPATPAVAMLPQAIGARPLLASCGVE